MMLRQLILPLTLGLSLACSSQEEDSQPKIYGGTLADGSGHELGYGSTFSLLAMNKGELMSGCTGSALTDRILITAKHCIDSYLVPPVGIGFGTEPLETFKDKKVTIEAIAIPFEDEKDSYHDFAVIITKESISGIIPWFKPIAVGSPLSVAFKSQSFVQLGYGYSDGEVYDSKLRTLSGYAKFHAMDDRSSLGTFLTSGNINEQKDTAPGDSGGPLISSDDKKLHGVLQGSTTLYDSENGESFHGRYSHPAYYLGWINDTLSRSGYYLSLDTTAAEGLENTFSQESSFFKPEDLFNENNRQCQHLNGDGYQVIEDYGCWPVVGEACSESWMRWDVESGACRYADE